MTLIPQTVVALSKFDIDGNKNIVEGAAFSVSFSDPGMPGDVVIYSTREGEILDPPYLTNSAGIFNFYINPGQYNYGINGTYYKVDVVGSSFDQITINDSGAISGGAGTFISLYAGSFNNVSAYSIKALLYTIVDLSGTSHNLEYSDEDNAFTIHRFTNAAEKTYTVRPNADHPVPTGAAFNLRNVGAGLLTIVADSGVTINPPAGGTLTVAQGGSVTLMCVAEDEYDLIGQAVSA